MQVLIFITINVILQNVVIGQSQAERETKTFQPGNENEKLNEFIESFQTVSQNRKGKFLPFRTRPIFSLLRQSPAINYKPVNNNDLFDFLRDSYPLPEGKDCFPVPVISNKIN